MSPTCPTRNSCRTSRSAGGGLVWPAGGRSSSWVSAMTLSPAFLSSPALSADAVRTAARRSRRTIFSTADARSTMTCPCGAGTGSARGRAHEVPVPCAELVARHDRAKQRPSTATPPNREGRSSPKTSEHGSCPEAWSPEATPVPKLTSPCLQQQQKRSFCLQRGNTLRCFQPKQRRSFCLQRASALSYLQQDFLVSFFSVSQVCFFSVSFFLESQHPMWNTPPRVD